MDIERIKDVVDKIDEKYLLRAAERIPEQNTKGISGRVVNAEEMTVIESCNKKPVNRAIKWLSFAAAFAFVVGGVTLAGIFIGGGIGTAPVGGGNAGASTGVEISGGESSSHHTGIEDFISSYVEKTEEEILTEKARIEASVTSNSSYRTSYSMAGQPFNIGGDSSAHVEYKGGEITVDGSYYFEAGEEIPEKASFGCYVVINGVVQELYVDGESIGNTFVHSDTREEIEKGKATGSFSFSFVPAIPQSDKDMKELEICLVHIRSPHFRVSPYYASSHLNHSNDVAGRWTLHTDNVPIENIIEETDSRFVDYEKTSNGQETALWQTEIYSSENDPYMIRCNGTSVDVKAEFVPSTDGKNVRYRLVFLVNGVPTTLSDGTPYIEINAEPDARYFFDAVTIDNIQPYDTVDVIPFVCDGSMPNPCSYSTFLSQTIYPEDYVSPHR